MYLIYNIAIHIALIVLLPYYIFRMATSGKYREGLVERLGSIGSKADVLGAGKRVWVHAVSVGEARAAMPLLRRIKEERPDIRIIFSTVTPTGQHVAKKEGDGLIELLLFLPLDFSWAIKAVLDKVRPDLFVIVEKEYWPNLIKMLDCRGVPVAVVNGTMSEGSFKSFKRFKFFAGDLFKRLSLFSARTELDARKARELGVPSQNIFTTGNMKFDMEATEDIDDKALDLAHTFGFGAGDIIFVAGSTHPGEEEILLKAFKRFRKKSHNLRLLIAPRHPERFNEVASIIEKSGLECVRRTRCSHGGCSEVAPVALLDTLGELFTAYALANIAFVGGSLVQGVGGHNLLEPAYFAAPVFYGPYISSCEEMASLIESADAGCRLPNAEALHAELELLLNDPTKRIRLGANGKALLEGLRGTTDKTFNMLMELIK